MNARLFALLFAASVSASLGADEPQPAAAGLVEVTTVNRTSIRIGPMSLSLAGGNKLEVLGRQGEFLVVKYRNSKGTVPSRDTDFNAKTMIVPEIAPEAPKSVVAVVVNAPDATYGGDRNRAASNSAKAATKAKLPESTGAAKAPQPAKPEQAKPYYPPVNN